MPWFIIAEALHDQSITIRSGVVYDAGLLVEVEGIVRVAKALRKVDADVDVDVEPRIGDWTLNALVFAVPAPAPAPVAVPFAAPVTVAVPIVVAVPVEVVLFFEEGVVVVTVDVKCEGRNLVEVEDEDDDEG